MVWCYLLCVRHLCLNGLRCFYLIPVFSTFRNHMIRLFMTLFINLGSREIDYFFSWNGNHLRHMTVSGQCFFIASLSRVIQLLWVMISQLWAYFKIAFAFCLKFPCRLLVRKIALILVANNTFENLNSLIILWLASWRNIMGCIIVAVSVLRQTS